MGRVFSMINPEQVSSTIERMVSNRSISYMDAVLELCEEHSIDTTMIAKYLSKPIIENIEKEAMDVNLLPRKKSLPFS
jgi:hypothetical protein